MGSREESGYAPFAVEQREGGTLRVVCADFRSAEDYLNKTTDDLTVPLSTQVLQAWTCKEAGVGTVPTQAGDSIAIRPRRSRTS